MCEACESGGEVGGTRRIPTGCMNYDKDTVVYMFEKELPANYKGIRGEYYTIIAGITLSLITWVVCLIQGTPYYIPLLSLLFFLTLYRCSYRKIRAVQIHRLALEIFRDLSGKKGVPQ